MPRGGPPTSIIGVLPLRRSLLNRCYVPTPRVRPQEPVWTEVEKLAGHVKWLDIYECLDHGRIAERLNVRRDFVYRVLEQGSYARVPDMEPPCHETSSRT